MNESQLSLLELCDHARRSCMANGLVPQRWHFGRDAILAHLIANPLPGNEDVTVKWNQPFTVFQGMLVYPMRALGVACIGKKPYVSLLEKSE